jgi:uncharacterized protein YkwD
LADIAANQSMKKILFAAYLLLSISFISCAQPKQVAGVSTVVNSEASSIENEVLRLVNKYRQSKGLSTLKMNSIVLDEARKHSTNMATGVVAFGHGGFDGRSQRLTQKIPGLRATGENVAYGQVSAKEVMEDWLNSPGHKKNIEGNFTQTGIGIVANRKGVLYYTQIFIR